MYQNLAFPKTAALACGIIVVMGLATLLWSRVEKIRKDLKEFKKFQLKENAKIMAAAEDLKAAVVRVATSAATEIRAAVDKFTTSGSDAAAMAQAVIDLNKTADALDAEATALSGGTPDNPPGDGAPPTS